MDTKFLIIIGIIVYVIIGSLITFIGSYINAKFNKNESFNKSNIIFIESADEAVGVFLFWPILLFVIICEMIINAIKELWKRIVLLSEWFTLEYIVSYIPIQVFKLGKKLGGN